MPWGVIFPGARAQDCGGLLVYVPGTHRSFEAGLEGLILFLILFVVARAGGFRRPGMITGIFAFGYGASRFLVEYFRVPDPQFFSDTNPYGFAFKFGEFGITMGQSLSLPMIGAGLVLLAASMRPSERPEI